jgi:peptide/nickel transport system permease protein
VARLDLGESLVTGERVTDELGVQLGHTLLLSFAALFLSLLIGPPLGLMLGLRAGSGADRAGLAAAAAIRALPPFVLGLLLILLFALGLGWLPPAGFDGLRELILPSLTLALGLAATSSRVTRDATAAVVAAPYFAFARWKGLSDRQALLRHGLRNAGVPVVAYVGMQLVWLIEGVVVVESLFAWPGVGHAMVHAIFARDIPMVQGTALVMGLMFVVLNALVDVACAAIDPRRRAA